MTALEMRDIITSPELSTDVILNMPSAAKMHRRHVIAWHNIREFAEKAYTSMPAEVLKIIGPLMAELSKLTSNIFIEPAPHR